MYCKDLVSVEEIVKDPDNYRAHITGADIFPERVETLREHTALAVRYYFKLIEEKGIIEICKHFIPVFFWEIDKDAEELFLEMLHSIVVFHDLGKINSEFQKRKMRQKDAALKCSIPGIGSKHSLVSSVIYIDYFIRKIAGIAIKEDRIVLNKFCFIFGYVIDRHHSDLDSLEKFLNLFWWKEEEEDASGEAAGILIALGKADLFINPIKLTPKGAWSKVRRVRDYCESLTREQGILLYGLTRLFYSLLVASDYYATSEFDSGVAIRDFGNIADIGRMMEVFEQTEINRAVSEYSKMIYPMSADRLAEERDINVLRNELYLDAQKTIRKEWTKDIFYLEAPTGSGKSNTAFQLSFQLMKRKQSLGKLFYVYPFNTLVEQNMDTLNKVFGGRADILRDIAVVNSTREMTQNKKEIEGDEKKYYQRVLLDRQFLNYPVIVTTHVSLFETIFGSRKEAVFGFHQLCNSVIVLDEIQSYKNDIWGEIIYFLEGFASLLNIKVIIMSATLPNLSFLTGGKGSSVKLIGDREKYFRHPCFLGRVKVNYELLNEKIDMDRLYSHLKSKILQTGKKILLEFQKKTTAGEFYDRLMADEDIFVPIAYMSGDDNILERKQILDALVKAEGDFILVATQVIEAGVDIDMDIGYKDISKLDSEEQFMGRINRSCRRNGTVYFFNLDNVKLIYGRDVRIHSIFSLENKEMQDILKLKNFSRYYEGILSEIRNENKDTSDSGLEYFFRMQTAKLDFKNVQNRMKLIQDNDWDMSVFLSRRIQTEGKEINGSVLWEQYKELLDNRRMDYAEKRVRLSTLLSKMNLFIYQIRSNNDLCYNDRIGDLLFIEAGEDYFKEGKLNRKKLEGKKGGGIGFI